MSASAARIVVATHRDAVRPHLEAWKRLYDRRLDDNLFVRPEFAWPLLEHASADDPYRVVLVYGGDGELIGLAIFAGTEGQRAGRSELSTWEHPLAFEMTPLLDRRHAAEAAHALCGWLRAPGRTWSMVRWSRVRLETESWAHLAREVDARDGRWWARHVFGRPALSIPPTWEEYLAAAPRSRRKRWKRLRRGLERAGSVEVRITRRADPKVVDAFLRLERSGWKGDEGTALACDRGQEAFFRAACTALGECGDLHFLELLLDGRPIAITANFLSGETLYAYKTAYDHEASRLSPGVVAELELVRVLQDSGAARTIDSCAGAESHVGGLWSDRRTIGEIMVATDALSSVSLAVAPFARASRTRARELWEGLRTAAG